MSSGSASGDASPSSMITPWPLFVSRLTPAACKRASSSAWSRRSACRPSRQPQMKPNVEGDGDGRDFEYPHRPLRIDRQCIAGVRRCVAFLAVRIPTASAMRRRRQAMRRQWQATRRSIGDDVVVLAGAAELRRCVVGVRRCIAFPMARIPTASAMRRQRRAMRRLRRRSRRSTCPAHRGHRARPASPIRRAGTTFLQPASATDVADFNDQRNPV